MNPTDTTHDYQIPSIDAQKPFTPIPHYNLPLPCHSAFGSSRHEVVVVLRNALSIAVESNCSSAVLKAIVDNIRLVEEEMNG